LTDAASARIRALTTGKPGTLGLKVGIKKGGCAGHEYVLALVDQKGRFDEVIEQDGATLIVDGAALMYLIGTELDFRSDKLSSQFVFKNPNQVSACGCGESIDLKPAERVPA
jgi:iron-sulfur cluster assembly protein